MRFEFGELYSTRMRGCCAAGRVRCGSRRRRHLLEVLIAARPRALGKQELMDAIWPGVFVVETNLANLIGEVRAALEDPRDAPRFVRTVHRFGTPSSTPIRPRRRAPAWAAGWQARWHDRWVELPPGRHVVGRGDQLIRVDHPSVSRVHGCAAAAPGGLAYEDSDSKNGSFLNGEPIDGIVDVRSRDVITVGTVDVTFVKTRGSASTQSVQRRAIRPRRALTRRPRRDANSAPASVRG